MTIDRKTLIGADGTFLGVGDKLPAQEATGRMSNETRRLFDLWVAAERRGRLPRLAEFPLQRIADLAPSMLVVEVLPEQHDYLYRQCGALEAQVRGGNPVGMTVRQCHEGDVRDFVLDTYDRVVASGEGVIDLSIDINRDKGYVCTEALLLPFSETGEAVTQILGYVHYVEAGGNLSPVE